MLFGSGADTTASVVAFTELENTRTADKSGMGV